MGNYGEPSIREYTKDDGTVMRITHEPGPYGGSTSYEVEGTVDQVTAHVEGVKRSYPPAGYSTWFNWPPGQVYLFGDKKGQPNTHRAPTDLGNGRWIARGHHSNSCE